MVALAYPAHGEWWVTMLDDRGDEVEVAGPFDDERDAWDVAVRAEEAA